MVVEMPAARRVAANPSITGIGLAAVLAKKAFARRSFDGLLVRALPAVSAAVILAAGVAMTLRAVPKVG